MIGPIEEYVLDGNKVIIQSKGDLFQIDLMSNALIAPKQIDREYTLYYPVYSQERFKGCPTCGLLITMPQTNRSVHTTAVFWQAEYYVSYEQIPYFYYIQDKENSGILPNPEQLCCDRLYVFPTGRIQIPGSFNS